MILEVLSGGLITFSEILARVRMASAQFNSLANEFSQFSRYECGERSD
jgi:hypothetical protein